MAYTLEISYFNSVILKPDTNVAQVPGKVGNWFTGEVEKTKEYQAKSWADMKTKWPFTMFKGNQ